MKHIWLLTKTNLKRNSFSAILAVISGMFLCLLLFAMGNMVAEMAVSKINIGLIDYDQSVLSDDFKNYMKEKLNYELIENNSYDELSTELIDKNISAIIEIPDNFYELFSSGKNGDVIVTTTDDYVNAAFLQANLNSYLASIELLSEGAKGNQETFDELLLNYEKEEVRMTQTAAQEINLKELKQKEGFTNSIGFFLMIIFAVGVIISFMIIEDRRSGVYNRIQITPVKPLHYIIGTALFGILLCAIEIGIYCGYISFMNLQIGFPLWILIIFMSLFSIFMIGFSIAIALAVKSKNTVTTIVTGYSTVGCVVGGAYFPLEMAPKSLQNLARIFPQFWFMDLFRSLQEKPDTLIYSNLFILALFTILILLIGAVLFSQNYKKS